jgi:hypothetical protein
MVFGKTNSSHRKPYCENPFRQVAFYQKHLENALPGERDVRNRGRMDCEVKSYLFLHNADLPIKEIPDYYKNQVNGFYQKKDYDAFRSQLQQDLSYKEDSRIYARMA